MRFISAILLALPLAAFAAPTEEDFTLEFEGDAETSPNLVARASGDITWFHPGLGACGKTNGDNDLIVAVSAGLYDSQKPCGRRMRVKGPKGSVDVTVVDRCGGCAYNDVDLSPAAFKKAVGNLGLGRKKVKNPPPPSFSMSSPMASYPSLPWTLRLT